MVPSASGLGQALPNVATCAVAKDPNNPMIIEWAATDKTNFAVRSQQGLVAVSYVHCHLKVLADCELDIENENKGPKKRASGSAATAAGCIRPARDG